MFLSTKFRISSWFHPIYSITVSPLGPTPNFPKIRKNLGSSSGLGLGLFPEAACNKAMALPAATRFTRGTGGAVTGVGSTLGSGSGVEGDACDCCLTFLNGCFKDGGKGNLGQEPQSFYYFEILWRVLLKISREFDVMVMVMVWFLVEIT